MVERHHLDLSREELYALGKHLDRGPLWTMSPRITVRQAIALKKEFRRALPPYERPELDSPLWYAMMKIHRVSEAGGQAGHRNVHDMFFTMVSLGGSWISLDDPVDKSLGFAREDGSTRQYVYLTHVKESWGMARDEEGRWLQREWDAPRWLREGMRTPAGRQEVARVLSSGDHCLEFQYADDVPPVVHRYIANGGRL